MKTMSSGERFAAIINGKKPDRVPVVGFAVQYTAKLAGVSLEEFYKDIPLCIKVQQLAKELHGYDDGISYGWADWGGWEFGGQVHFPQSYEESAPSTAVSPVEKVSDVDKLSVKDIRSAGMIPYLLEFNRLVTAEGAPAKLRAGSVTSIVASIIGKERLLLWYLMEPEAVKAVYEKATEFLIQAADLMLSEFGGKGSASISAPLDSNDLISPDLFEKFTVPYQSRVNQWLIDHGVTSIRAHICGNQKHNLAAWASIPWPPRTIFSVGREMDMAEVAEAFGHQHIVAGNVSTTMLGIGSYEEVYSDAKRSLEEGKDFPGGFILMSACELPVLTPPLNVQAMIQASKDHGRYS